MKTRSTIMIALASLVCTLFSGCFIDVNKGIERKPNPADTVPQGNNIPHVQERNMMTVLVKAQGQVFVDDRLVELNQLKDEVKAFMVPRPNDMAAPEVEVKTIALLGDVLVSKGVVSLKNTRDCSYEMYVAVQNELSSAFNELRDEMAVSYFNRHLDQLDEEQMRAISDAVPVRISEAEPVNN